MRITVLILGFGLGAVMFVQTFLVYGLSSIGDDTQSSRAATAGLCMVVLWLFAVAFIFGVPWLSVLLFAVAGLIGIGNADNFPDLEVWGIASFILAGLSAVSIWQARKEPRQRLGGQGVDAVSEVSCPNCGAKNSLGARFCSSCSHSLTARVCPACGHMVSPRDAFCSHCGVKVAEGSSAAPSPQPVHVEETPPASEPRVPVLLGVCILAVTQVLAWYQSGGTFGYGNYLGAAVIVGVLVWFVYWVRRNGRGGIALPEAVWSILGPYEPPSPAESQADGDAQPRFPSKLVSGILILAAVGSFLMARVDDRHRSIRVNGTGMEPTISNGSLWTVAQHAYRSAQPSRGDMIVFVDSGAQGQSVKRVVGLPGERVTIEGGEVKIDGKPISEPYAEGTTHCGSGDDCDIVLGDSEVFVLGDNRSNSVDSRSNGPVDLTRIRGKITKVLWPPALP